MKITVKEIKITRGGYEATFFWSHDEVKELIGKDPEWFLNNEPLQLLRRALEEEET